MVWLLDGFYDSQHRAYFMSEMKKVIMILVGILEFVFSSNRHAPYLILWLACLQFLQPLKIRSHGVSCGVMPYDERYTPYIRQTRLLPFIQLVSRSTPNLNAATITVLVDWWRMDTHNFHLWTGEMTMTLQDVALITVFPSGGSLSVWAPIPIGGASRWRPLLVCLLQRLQWVRGIRRKESQTELHSPRLLWTLRIALRMLMRMWCRHMLVSTCGTLSPGLCLLTPLARMLHGCGGR